MVRRGSVARRQRLAMALAAAVGLALARACGVTWAATAAVPTGFQADELSIRLTLREPGSGQRAARLVLAAAAGTPGAAQGGSLERAGQTRPFRHTAKERVDLLNALYRIQFFDLPERYAAGMVARLGADGRVELAGFDATDATGNSVCVNIASFEKCVRYGNQVPADLDRLARQVLAEADRLTRP